MPVWINHGSRCSWYVQCMVFKIISTKIAYNIHLHLFDIFNYICLWKRWLHSWVEISHLLWITPLKFVTHPVFNKSIIVQSYLHTPLHLSKNRNSRMWMCIACMHITFKLMRRKPFEAKKTLNQTQLCTNTVQRQ